MSTRGQMTNQNNQPFGVSVIIPTYNRASLIHKAIDSALAQTYPNVEIIVVDDGSTDNTKEVIAAYGDRVRYIYQSNAGPSAARNNGAHSSDARFIAFLDSDDTIYPTKLEKQVAYLKAHPDVDIVLCGWVDLDPVGKVVEKVESLPTDRILETILMAGMRGVFSPNVPLTRSECFLRVGGFDVSLPAREEQDFWMRAELSGNKYGIVEEVLCTFESTPNSRGKNIPNVEKAMPIILGKIFNHPQLNPHIAALKNEVYARVYLDFGIYYLGKSQIENSPELKLAREYLTKALELRPSHDAWREEFLERIPYQILQLSSQADSEESFNQQLDFYFPKYIRPAWLETELRSRLHTILAFQAYQNGRSSDVRREVYQAIRSKPSSLKNKGLSSIFIKSLLGRFPQCD